MFLWDYALQQNEPRMLENAHSETGNSSSESKICVSPLSVDDREEMLAIVSAIPDGIRLAQFPSHSEGIDCWCRPRITFSLDTMIVSHKDLSQGDFDC